MSEPAVQTLPPTRPRLRQLAATPALRLLLARFPLLVFALLFVYMALGSEFFLEWRNISSILRQSAPDAILAAGLAVVVTAGGDDIVSGGIDISLPAAATLGVGILSDQLVNGRPFVLAMLLAAAAVIAVGLLNAALVVKVGLTPLLATLASWVAVVGTTKWVIDNRRITVDDPLINSVRDGTVLNVPVPAVFALAVLIVLSFWIHRTRFGHRLQASGGNRSAAEISGLNPDYFLARSFVMASLAAVVASVVLTARGSGLSPGIEERLLLDMVLATFVGAAFSFRRVVTVPGAMLGALLVKALGSGFQLLNVDIFKVGMVKGVLILIVVASAALEAGQRR
ncbi:MAG: ABC transporter permease [Acidimicrobiaceae bacterium]|nr:ABC transporter permease [Acidimicrobiaceae bacterium]MCY4281156.1 ABC transporter permease [Acidimicrobiaceae bacterium]MCY4294381.1 ABC transporter permease [Acidimicrobiaceae bacterium]